MAAPDVSVLVVSFNTRDRLRECLRTLHSQTGAVNFETVLVDNASRDGSADMVAKEFPRVKLIRSKANLGFANANNLALPEASGRYLVLLNPDAALPPDTLERSVRHMEAEPAVGMGGGRLIGADGSLQPSGRLFPSPLNEVLVLSGLAHRFAGSRVFGRADRTWADPLQPADVDWVPGAFAIIPRQLAGELGLFDPRFFLYYEEVDLCRRIRAAGRAVRYWPDLCITHIGGESSKTVTELNLSKSGSQLTLWRMRSQLLYYRKWHGPAGAWVVKSIEQAWHALRAFRNRNRAPAKAEESRDIVATWRQAWIDTDGGRVSPPQPW
jgi:GT2 family glycosyltransferase